MDEGQFRCSGPISDGLYTRSVCRLPQLKDVQGICRVADAAAFLAELSPMTNLTRLCLSFEEGATQSLRLNLSVLVEANLACLRNLQYLSVNISLKRGTRQGDWEAFLSPATRLETLRVRGLPVADERRVTFAARSMPCLKEVDLGYPERLPQISEFEF